MEEEEEEEKNEPEQFLDGKVGSKFESDDPSEGPPSPSPTRDPQAKSLIMPTQASTAQAFNEHTVSKSKSKES